MGTSLFFQACSLSASNVRQLSDLAFCRRCSGGRRFDRPYNFLTVQNFSTSTDYSVKAYADNLLPFLSATGPYDIVIGGSWGSIVTLAILPHISDARRIVMVDPPLELSNDTVDEIRNLTINDISNTMTVDENMKLMNWVKDVAVWRGLARQLCRVAAVEGTFQHNKPWSFTHLLPGPSPTQEMMILAADPSVWALFTQEEAAELKRTHPHIKMKLVKGAGHAMILQVPYRNIIIEAALGRN